MVIHTTHPAKTGARFRFTLNNVTYWVSAPKRGFARAWFLAALTLPKGSRMASEIWSECTLAEVAAARGDTIEAIILDAVVRSFAGR